ncbi:MAG: hypothetical protein FH753_01685 [Firmicutes bacterium]|nr:hypothetical protein [Bacillota bacterium]
MKKLIVIILILVIGIYVISTTVFNDIKGSKFSTYEEALTTIEKGWIPEDLPKAAEKIYEVHDLDSNNGNGKFYLPKEDIKKFIISLEKTDREKLLKKEQVKAKWWNESKIKESIKNGDLILGERKGFIYAVDKEGIVYYWIK